MEESAKELEIEKGHSVHWIFKVQKEVVLLLLRLSVTGPRVEAERPLSVQSAQRPELQGHGVRTGAGRVLVLQGVVVVVLDGLPQGVQWEGPEPVEVDLLAEACGQRVHEQTSGGPLDVHFVRQPIPGHKDTRTQQRSPAVGRSSVELYVFFSFELSAKRI